MFNMVESEEGCWKLMVLCRNLPFDDGALTAATELFPVEVDCPGASKDGGEDVGAGEEGLLVVEIMMLVEISDAVALQKVTIV